LSGTLEQRRRQIGIAAVLPALLVLAAVLGYPILDSMWLSLNKVNVGASGFARTFVGVANYVALADDPKFHASLLRSAYFITTEVVAVTLLGLGVALLLVHPLGRFGIFRIMLLVPWAIAPVANAVLWKWILNANYGILNVLLSQLGVIDGYVTWLGTPWRALNMILLIDVWKSIPFIAILFLAGLSKIPPMLYRAARLDGANTWAQFRYITLPALKPTIGIAVVLQTLWSLRVFELVFVLTKGAPADGTVLLNYFAYRTTFDFLDLGYGAAVANVIFALSFLLAATYVWLLRPGRRRRGV
jgi:multiple sugar transport system permease protein